jgi:hypothetical protein
MSNIRNNRDMRSDGFRNLNHSQSARDSGRRLNLNEQTQYNSNHRHCAKRDSTTLDTTSECP